MRRLLATLLAGLLSAQEAQQPIRVSVTLVQVDVVVLDGKGRQVTDLTKDDFEIFDNGKPKAVTRFSYERTDTANTTQSGARQAPARHLDQPLRPEDVRRTIAVLVDDLKMSFESVHQTREALKKFVDEQIQPGDLVSVISTSGGISIFQQFTTDKKRLHAAIARIRYLLAGGGSGGSVKALGGGGQEIDPLGVAQIRQRQFTVGTLGAMRHVVDGMKEMPGRKSLILFSESLIIANNRKDETEITAGEMFRIADTANGAAVVIYGVDPRGIPFTGLQAQDDTSLMEQEELRDALDERQTRIRESQGGLRLLAAATGGRVHLDDNDLNAGLRRVLEEQSGYYLLGFQKGEEAERIDAKGTYRRLQVRVKRPGVRVQYRRGYMGDNTPSAVQAENSAQRLISALRSPFAGKDVQLKLTPGFGLTDRGQAVQALVHIAGAGLSFRPEDPAGYQSAELHIAAIADGEAQTGRVTTRTYTIRAKKDAVQKIQDQGFVYEFQHEVKKPGPYYLRLAVMDALSGRIGSGSCFVEVPDLRKGGVAMSTVSMSAGDWRESLRAGPATQQGNDFAVRTFTRQHPFSYGVTLYNAPLNQKTGQPGIELQPFLIRGEKVVWEGKPIPVVLQPGMDARRIPAGGVLTLGTNTAPGEYVLELKALSLASRRELFSQAVDFELR